MRKLNPYSFFSIKSAKEKVIFLLQYAVLAPSTHNTQPWLFKVSYSMVDIYLDAKKKLPYTDPIDRDIYISIGCCIENLIIAAKSYDVDIKFELILSNNHIARIVFDFPKKNRKIKDESMLRSILERQNYRKPYESRKVSSRILSKLQELSKEYKTSSISIIKDKEQIIKISELTAQASRDACREKGFRLEMSKWFTSNVSSRKDGIPGYAANMSLLISLLFPQIVRLIDVGHIVSKVNFKNLSSAQVVFVISTKLNDKGSWVDTGRFAERIMVELQNENIKSTIFAAAVEVNGYNEKLQKLIKSKQLPQFLFSAGYSESRSKYTPRVPVQKKLIIQ